MEGYQHLLKPVANILLVGERILIRSMPTDSIGLIFILQNFPNNRRGVATNWQFAFVKQITLQLSIVYFTRVTQYKKDMILFKFSKIMVLKVQYPSVEHLYIDNVSNSYMIILI